MFRQQLAASGAAFGAFAHTLSPVIPTNLPMYYENPITLFPNLSSTYMSGSVASLQESLEGKS